MVKVRSRPRIVVIYNRDFEGAESDPENKAREDVKHVAHDVLRVLTGSGFDVGEVGVTNDVSAALAAVLATQPDAVFNLCESIHGDNRFESLMPLLLDLHGIPYTGSCPFALSLALRKEKVKEILRGSSVPVPRGMLVTSAEACSALGLDYPVIVKPAHEDASVGISSASVVGDAAALARRVSHVLTYYRQPALVEEFIDGREIYVSVLERIGQEPRVFPFFEIDFSDLPANLPKIVSFEGKWIEDSDEYKGTRPVPCAALGSALRATVHETALRAFRAVGVRDYGRVDIRLSRLGIPYVIDVNPNCDLSDLAGGYSRAAKAAGLTYNELIVHLTQLALARRTVAPRPPIETPRAEAGEPVAAMVSDALPEGQSPAPRGRACSA